MAVLKTMIFAIMLGLLMVGNTYAGTADISIQNDGDAKSDYSIRFSVPVDYVEPNTKDFSDVAVYLNDSPAEFDILNGDTVFDSLYVDNFQKYSGNPLIRGTESYEAYGIRDPCPLIDTNGHAVVENGKYVMYYKGRDNATNYTDSTVRVESSDMVTWVNKQKVFSYALTGIIKDGSNYVGFCPYNTSQGIVIANSTNGLNWTFKNSTYPVVTPSQVNCSIIGMPTGAKVDGTWYMVFEGTSNVDGLFHLYMAKSTDLVNWTVCNNGTPIYSSKSLWDIGGQANPQLYEIRDGGYVIAYNGCMNQHSWELGVLHSTEIESSWESWENNPILSRASPEIRMEGARFVRDDFASDRLRLWYFVVESTDSIKNGTIRYATCERSTIDIVAEIPNLPAGVTTLEVRSGANEASTKDAYTAYYDGNINTGFTVQTNGSVSITNVGEHAIIRGNGTSSAFAISYHIPEDAELEFSADFIRPYPVNSFSGVSVGLYSSPVLGASSAINPYRIIPYAVSTEMVNASKDGQTTIRLTNASNISLASYFNGLNWYSSAVYPTNQDRHNVKMTLDSSQLSIENEAWENVNYIPATVSRNALYNESNMTFLFGELYTNTYAVNVSVSNLYVVNASSDVSIGVSESYENIMTDSINSTWSTSVTVIGIIALIIFSVLAIKALRNGNVGMEIVVDASIGLMILTIVISLGYGVLSILENAI